jgi:hypothetical protein
MLEITIQIPILGLEDIEMSDDDKELGQIPQ